MRDTSKRVGGRRNASKPKKASIRGVGGRKNMGPEGRKGYLKGKCRGPSE